MVSTKAFFLILAMASSVLLAGCYTWEPITPERYRQNPEILKHGDTVIVHTSDSAPLKGTIISSTNDAITLHVRSKIQESVSTDKLTLLELRQASGWKIFGITILGAAGVALFVGAVYLIVLAVRGFQGMTAGG
jgi:hypothetical protein